MSSIGLYVTRWQHPPVKGINGQIDPDADIKSLRARLAEEASQSSSVEKTLVHEDNTTDQEIRTRHVTGEEKETPQQKGDIPQDEEEILLAGEELSEITVFHTRLTEEQQEEYLKVAAVPAASSTPTRRNRSENSPTGAPDRKQHRRTKKDGSGQSDRSDTEL